MKFPLGNFAQRHRYNVFLVRIQSALHSSTPIIRLFDFIFSLVLFRLPIWLRKQIFGGKSHICPICKTHLKNFLKLHRHYHRWCPICQSLQRHRLLWIFLNSEYLNMLHTNPKILHIAPEPSIGPKLKTFLGDNYISADLRDRNAMVQMDICNIQYPDHSFDLILCSHVLEHIDDDRRAMREFWRVLTIQGKAVIIVPISSDCTVEDPSITDPHEREILFGQFDHVRRYGNDFVERLQESGFVVKKITTEDLATKEDIIVYGLNSDENIFLCTKTT